MTMIEMSNKQKCELILLRKKKQTNVQMIP